MDRRAIVFLCMAAACGRKGAPPLASSSLWALAPPGADFAVVLRDGGLPPLLRGLQVLATKTDPVVAAEVRAELKRLPVDVLDDASLKAAGVDLGLGVAIFGVRGRTVIVGPVSDGTKLREKLGSGWSCRQVHGRVACADDEAALAKVGTSAALADEIKKASLEMRGDIEAYVATPAGTGLPIEDPRGLWITAQFGPGAVTVRARLGGRPRLPPIPAMTLAGGLAEERPSGLMCAQVGAWLEPLTRMKAPVAGGLDAGTIARALTGEVVAWQPPGGPARGFARVGVKDASIVRRLLDACDELAIEPWLATHKEGDRCKALLKLPNLPQPIPAEAWLDGGTLTIGFGEHTVKVAARGELSLFASEVLEGKWALASWGRGLYAFILPDMGAALRASAQPAMAKSVMALLSHLTELGLAVGWDDEGYRAVLRVATTFASPDEVVTALQPLLARLADGDASAVADVLTLAKKYPDSPLAQAVQSGGSGAVAAAVFVPGVLAAVAIPAFMRNARKAKTVEATVMVKRLYDGARAYYEEGAGKRFPGPSAAATPAGTCCGHPGDKCPPDPSLWAREPWTSLKFSMDDPHYYRYEYEVAGDGKSFTARALGDLDCDGEYSTFELVGSVAADGTVTGSAGIHSNQDLE